jgi:hypothetical protein
MIEKTYPVADVAHRKLEVVMPGVVSKTQTAPDGTVETQDVSVTVFVKAWDEPAMVNFWWDGKFLELRLAQLQDVLALLKARMDDGDR